MAANIGTEPPELQPFQYDSLPSALHIRLLYILPADDTGSSLIQCVLTPVDLKDRPSYDALSYTWGCPFSPNSPRAAEYNTHDTYPINVNGRLMKVGKNLHDALCQLSKPHDPDSEVDQTLLPHHKTPLIEAVENETLGDVRILLSRGANVRAQDASGKTALHYAVEKARPDVFNTLLMAGSDPRQVDSQGRTAAQCLGYGSQSAKFQELFKLFEHQREPRQPEPHISSLGRLIWIDAICINQEDIEEKTQQLRIMGSIYRSATSTLVWLGAEAEDSDLAFDTLVPVSQNQGSLAMYTDAWPMGDLTEVGMIQFQQMLKTKTEAERDRAMRAFVALYERAYWQRIWILQEIILAPDAIVMCGTKCLSWCTFLLGTSKLPGPMLPDATQRRDFPERRLAFRIQDVRSRHRNANGIQMTKEDMYVSDLQRQGITQTGGIIELRGVKGKLPGGNPTVKYASPKFEPVGLIKLLLHFDYALATDPRDIIYGLLGLAEDGEALVPLPDYNQGYVEVCLDFTMRLIQTTGKLNITCVSPFFERRPSGMPTWALDSTTRVGDGLARDIILKESQSSRSAPVGESAISWVDSGIIESACGDGQFKTQYPEVSNDAIGPCLHALGVILDTVDGLGGAVDTARGSCSTMMQSEHHNNAYGSYNEIAEALWQSLIQRPVELIDWNGTRWLFVIYESARKGRMEPNFGPDVSLWCEATRDLSIAGSALSQVLELSCSGHEWTPVELQFTNWRHDSKKRNFLISLRKTMQQKRLMVTEEGRVGVVPLATDKGDKIAIMFGCDVPVVVRPLDSGGHVLIGEAYIHGVMKGEAVAIFDDKQLCDLQLY